MTADAGHEMRMLVDGELIEADSGQTFDNVNPATEAVLGPVADASNAEMHRAIDAARRAFDESDWATTATAARRACPSSKRPWRRIGRHARGTDPRGRLPADDHLRQSARHPPGGCVDLPDQAHRRVPVAHRADGCGRSARHRQHPPDLEGTGRRGRGRRPVELPARGHAEQARPSAGHREHGRAQAGSGHAVERHPPGPPRGRADRIPPGVLNVVTSADHLVGED